MVNEARRFTGCTLYRNSPKGRTGTLCVGLGGQPTAFKTSPPQIVVGERKRRTD